MVVEASKVPTHGAREGKLKLTGQVGSMRDVGSTNL